MGSVKRVMELDCLQMNARSSLIDYHSSGCFLFIVRALTYNLFIH